jgi:hypothetical protein
MKRILVVVCAIAIGVSAISAKAQVPNVGVFFDQNLQYMWADCPPGTPLTVLDTCYVALHNANMFVGSVEYMIEYPPYMSYMGDIVPGISGEDYLKAGNSNTGIGVVWPIPKNGFQGILVHMTRFLWNCNGCDAGEQCVMVLPHPDSGKIRAIRWPDLWELPLVGMTSSICKTVPVEENTWGGIKALYE